jgi:HAD superfamily hydrolase (TIGR01509 family)
MARAFCFDLDGTLMDSEVIWVEVIEEFLRAADPSATHEEALRLVYGKSWHDVYDGIRRRIPGLKQSFLELMVLFEASYNRLLSRRDVRIEGSVRLLRRLARDSRVCIVSGSTRSAIEDAIGMLGIADDLRFFISSEDFQPGKPHPGCYRMAVERLGLPAGECVAFEDSEVGMRAARGAGLYTVALARPGAPAQDTSAAHVVVADLGDLDPAELLGPAPAGCGAP